MQVKLQAKPGASLGEPKDPGREEARTDEARSSKTRKRNYRAIKRLGEIVSDLPQGGKR